MMVDAKNMSTNNYKNNLGENRSMMIISTSIAVPFVLPSIVYVLVGSQFSISISQMIFLLSVALFTPLTLGWLTKRYIPAISKFADEKSFLLSLIL